MDMRVPQVRTVTRRVLLPAIPVALVIAAGALAQAKTSHHSVTVTVNPASHSTGNQASLPHVNVNGHDLSVPASGTATLNQGDTTTTVTQQPSSDGSKGSTTTTTTDTTGPGDSVHIQVTSDGGSKSTHSHVFYNSSSGGGETSRTHSDVNITSHGTGEVHVSQ